MPDITIAGDSIFDNAPYVPRQKSVRHILNKAAPGTYDFIARDGAIIRDTTAQVNTIRGIQEMIFISAGGNDALGAAHMLSDETLVTPGDTLEDLARIRSDFFLDYYDLITTAAARATHVACMTIYEPPELSRNAHAAIGMLNDCIYHIASMDERVTVLETRTRMTHPSYFTQTIEPSEAGGVIIANMIINHVDKIRGV